MIRAHTSQAMPRVPGADGSARRPRARVGPRRAVIVLAVIIVPARDATARKAKGAALALLAVLLYATATSNNTRVALLQLRELSIPLILLLFGLLLPRAVMSRALVRTLRFLANMS